MRVHGALRGVRGVLAVMSVIALAFAQEPPAAGAELSCRVCHTSATRGLAQSAHGALLRRAEQKERACSSCHGDLSAHAAAAGKGVVPLPPVPRVEVASCKTCHGDQKLDLAAARHPLQHAGSGQPAPKPPELPRALDDTQPRVAEWAGFAALGYRFVHHSGSRDGFDTDLDLDPGLRLREFELRGQRLGSGLADDVTLSAIDLGDPRWSVGAEVRRDGSHELSGGHERDHYRYRVSGDHHHVDRESAHSHGEGSLELGRGVRLFADFARLDEDGYWLTQRMGNRNLPVQTFVDGVESPRSSRRDQGALGIGAELAGWQTTVAFGYLDARDDAQWQFDQPATANPAFRESEDFASRTTLRGPDARLHLARDFGEVQIDLSLRVFDHDYRMQADGTGAGYDIGEFTTTTVAGGDGTARTWLGDADVAIDCSDEITLHLELHWRDHEEHLTALQTDTKSYTGLGGSTTVVTATDALTRQRMAEAAATVEWAPSRSFSVAAGYGGAREHLRVPQQTPSDPNDYVSGDARDRGLLADLRWRPDEAWILRAGFRDFAQDGVPLHELAPERARELRASLGFDHDGTRATVFARKRRNENDVSQHHLDSFSTGVEGGCSGECGSLDAGYTFTRIDSATLSNFYFDPDPNPQPTYVGFAGDTHSVHLTHRLEFGRGWRTLLSGMLTDTTGSFDVTMWEVRGGLQCQIMARAAVGLEYRHLDYADQNGVDDWGADLFWLYWRQEF